MNTCKSVLLWVVFAIIAGAMPAHATCSNASLNGTFGQLFGLNPSAGFGTELAQLSFDGNGNMTESYKAFVSNGGGAWHINSALLIGVYSVSSDCTGTLTTIRPWDGTVSAQYTFAIQKGGQSLQMVNILSGVETLSLVAQGSAACGLTGIKRTFAADLSGFVAGSGPIGYVGQVILDGKGNMSGTMTVNLNGSVATAPITGSYTESANCLGTATISSSAFGTLDFDFVVVNSGNQLLVIETDANTYVSGTMPLGLQP